MYTKPQNLIAFKSERERERERELLFYCVYPKPAVFWNLRYGESSFPVTRVESRSFIPVRLRYM